MKSKTVIMILFIIACYVPAWGAAYYVSAEGNDTKCNGHGPDPYPGSGSGLTCAWKTIGKVNSASFSSGDMIYFRRGDMFSDADLTPPRGNLTFGAYGPSATPPIITGATAHSLLNSARNNNSYFNLNFQNLGMYIGGASQGIAFNDCIVSNIQDNYGLAANGASIVVNNCVFINVPGGAVTTTGSSPSVSIRNSIFLGSGMSGPFIPSATGQISYENTQVAGNSYTPATSTISSMVADLGNNIVSRDPLLQQYRYPVPQVAFTVDDSGNIAYFNDIMNAGFAYGVKGTLFIYSSYPFSTQDQTTLQNLISAGHEIGLHSWSHSNLTSTSAFTISTTNASPSITIDGSTTKTLVLSTTTPGNSVTIDWSSGVKMIRDLQSTVSGKGWTISLQNTINNAVRLSSLKNGSTSSFPYTAQLDVGTTSNRFYYDETVGAASALSNITGTNPLTFAYPGGAHNDSLVSYIKNSGAFISARSISAQPFSKDLSSLNIWKVLGIFGGLSIKGDGSEGTIRANARNLYVYARTVGIPLVIYTHTASDMTPAQMGYLMSEFYNLGVTFSTYHDLMTSIRSDHATTDGINWTKNYPDTTDYHLSTGSPCIGAGTYVAGYNDIYPDLTGIAWQSPPSIGIYEYVRPLETLSATVSAGSGTITPASAMPPYGSTVSFTIAPSTGYYLSSLIDNGIDVTSSVVKGSYTLTNVTANHSLTASFNAVTETLNTTVTTGSGTITPASAAVSYGATVTFSITPDTGYRLSTLVDNGIDMTNAVIGSNYTISNISTNHLINLNFTPAAAQNFSITSVVVNGTGGVLTPGSSTVVPGGSAAFSIAPDTGYFLTSLTDNGINVTNTVANGNYNILNIAADHTIQATFSPIPPAPVPAMGLWGILVAVACLAGIGKRNDSSHLH